MIVKGFVQKAVSSISKYQHDTRMRWLRNTTKNSGRIIGGQAATKPGHLLSRKSKRYLEYIGQTKSSMAIEHLILFSKNFIWNIFRSNKQLKQA